MARRAPDSATRSNDRQEAADIPARPSTDYVLGGTETELIRLRAQAQEYEDHARWLLETVGVRPGAALRGAPPDWSVPTDTPDLPGGLDPPKDIADESVE
jgi:hypothetical protein